MSKLDDDLKIEGRHEVNLHGEDGVKMDGGDIYLAAEESIDLTTVSEDVQLSARPITRILYNINNVLIFDSPVGMIFR